MRDIKPIRISINEENNGITHDNRISQHNDIPAGETMVSKTVFLDGKMPK